MAEFLRAIYDVCGGISLAYIVLGGFSLGFLFFLALNFFVIASDRLGFFLRWARLILATGYVYIALGFALDASLAMYILSPLIVIWGEFAYVYIKAELYSRRNVLPFAGFVACDNAWRPDKKFYKLKGDIEAEGFERIASYRAKNPLCLASLFYDKSEIVALLVLFPLYRAKLRTLYYVLGKKRDGVCEIFTNDFSENILFLDENYNIQYKLLASFKSLLGNLKDNCGEGFVDFEAESLDLPHLLYRANAFEATSKGFYLKNREGGQFLSAEGKFQFSKNLIIKNFFRF